MALQNKYIKKLSTELRQRYPHISLTDSDGLLVGSGGAAVHAVDLERLRPRHQAFADFVMSPAEKHILADFPERLRSTWAWCIKEACFKCAAAGYEPSDFIIRDRKGRIFEVRTQTQAFRVAAFDSISGYALCLALVPTDTSAIIHFNEQRNSIARAARAL